MSEEAKIVDNVYFREPVYFGQHGTPSSTYKPGLYKGTVAVEKGFVVIDIPAFLEKRRLIIHVPFSNIRQIEFKATV